MSLMAGILIVVCVWWLTFFIVLAIGVETEASPNPGMAWGHPTKAPILKKMLITTVATTVISAGIIVYLTYYPLDFRLQANDPAFTTVEGSLEV